LETITILRDEVFRAGIVLSRLTTPDPSWDKGI